MNPPDHPSYSQSSWGRSLCDVTRRVPPLVPRMREHAASIFGEMSALAVETGSVNLGQGFPDTDGPQSVKDAAIRAIEDGRGNQYPPVHGLPELRRAIADWATDVCVATGASEAIVATLLALVDTGDEVVMFAPWFDVYAAGISLANGVRREVPLTPGTFRPDVDALRAAITPRTRLLLLN